MGGGGKQFWEVHLEGDPDEYYILVGVAKTSEWKARGRKLNEI